MSDPKKPFDHQGKYRVKKYYPQTFASVPFEEDQVKDNG
jgi:hypothetical protein